MNKTLEMIERDGKETEGMGLYDYLNWLNKKYGLPSYETMDGKELHNEIKKHFEI